MSYDHKTTDKKWQKNWQDSKIYHASNDSKKPKKYVLIEFPYPSGEGLHMGHLRPYLAGDIYSRTKRMQGFETMFPIGWDAFGLPAENFAIKKGVHPSVSTAKNIANAKKQLQSWGIGFDWEREVNTTDPQYYKWTQWIFLQLYKAGLAYEATGLINWCPKDKTGLANEEVIDGKCDRCGTVVVKKEMKQWYLKITTYAEKLLEGLKNLNWPEQVKTQQANWIGKSEGAEIEFELDETTKVKRIVILHGRASTGQDNFFPWLKKELEKKGFEVETPTLPNPTGEPDDMQQTRYVMENCRLDNQTVVVGHSMGGIVALRLLEQGAQLNGVVLVGTPFTGKFLDDKPRPSVSAAAQRGFDFEKIKKNSQYFEVVCDLEDKLIPVSDAEMFAEKLGVKAVKVTANKPHFQGAEEPGVLNVIIPRIKVFTTRPDTIFGATYMVLAPEHSLVEQITTTEQKNYVINYVIKSKQKSEQDRLNAEKEKTGVFTGAYAINPATKEKIPVWIADYVLASYGTGAIMAVPAHDERDFEFAKKYNLPVKQVVMPSLLDVNNPPEEGKENTFRKLVLVILHNPKTDKYLTLKWKKFPWTSFITGGVEDDENREETAKREIVEETGYTNVRLVESLGLREAFFFAAHKNVNRHVHSEHFLFELLDEKQVPVKTEEKDMHEPQWLTLDELKKANLQHAEAQLILKKLETDSNAYSGEGILMNSGKFDGLQSEEAILVMAKEFGVSKVQYKLRDWVFSRQRYWGEPIPLIHCDKCGIVPVPEDQLPVTLPEVEKYEPTGTGESPLAAIDSWVNTKCPKCDGPAKRETNTMPQWAGSSWYWLRYTDPQNDKELASKKALKYWTPVDVYFGGMEHTTLHLLYSRFWNLFLYDQGIVTAQEAYAVRVPHGIILAADGEKMSKSRGNVVNPDDIVAEYGADVLRMFEPFLGPHEATLPWNDKGIVGIKRFLDKAWKYQESFQEGPENRNIHKLIKKITKDIEQFKFNTAIAAFMEFLNENKEMSRANWEAFLILLAPFASHMTEELWSQLGHKDSIHRQPWPRYDEKLTQDENVTIVVQVLGRVRASLEMPAGSSLDEVKDAAMKDQNVQKFLAGKEIVKEIFVKDKLINLVIK